MSEFDTVGAGTAAGGAVVLKASFPALEFKVFEMFGIFYVYIRELKVKIMNW